MEEQECTCYAFCWCECMCGAWDDAIEEPCYDCGMNLEEEE